LATKKRMPSWLTQPPSRIVPLVSPGRLTFRCPRRRASALRSFGGSVFLVDAVGGRRGTAERDVDDAPSPGGAIPRGRCREIVATDWWPRRLSTARLTLVLSHRCQAAEVGGAVRRRQSVFARPEPSDRRSRARRPQRDSQQPGQWISRRRRFMMISRGVFRVWAHLFHHKSLRRARYRIPHACRQPDSTLVLPAIIERASADPTDCRSRCAGAYSTIGAGRSCGM